MSLQKIMYVDAYMHVIICLYMCMDRYIES